MSTTTMQALLPGLDSPLIGSVKNERAIMVYPFFNLSAVDKKTELPVYDDGRVRIEVKGTKSGVATIYDAEFVIYVASLMVDKMNRGLPVTQSFSFSGHDFFRVTGVSVGGKNYERFEGALDRLQGTQIKTNIETGGEGTDEWFSWCKTAKVEYRKNAKGEKIIKRITVELCDWLYRAILKDNRMLTYDPVYFKLPPLEKRLYEMARAHCGNQAGFRIGLEKLRMRVGSDLALKDFKSRLVKIAAKQRPLPEYGFKLIDKAAERRAEPVVPGAPPKRTRTNPRNVVVVFWRLDRWREYDAERFPEADEAV